MIFIQLYFYSVFRYAYKNAIQRKIILYTTIKAIIHSRRLGPRSTIYNHAWLLDPEIHSDLSSSHLELVEGALRTGLFRLDIFVQSTQLALGGRLRVQGTLPHVSFLRS